MHVTNNYLGDRHSFSLKVRKADSLQCPPYSNPLQANRGVVTKYAGFSKKAGLQCSLSYTSWSLSDVACTTVSNSYLGTDRQKINHRIAEGLNWLCHKKQWITKNSGSLYYILGWSGSQEEFY